MITKKHSFCGDGNILACKMKEDINFIASKTIRNDNKIDKINEKLKAIK